MTEFVPLIQTILWVGLIAAVVLRYHKPIENLLNSLRARIDSGAGLKLGPVELAELAKPQAPEQQARKLDEEIAQIAKFSQIERPGEVKVPTREKVRSLYLKAEDLALREIQDEYQAPIGRQIQIGSNLEFDGAFAKDGTLHVIEIKYLADHPAPAAFVEQTIDRLVSRIRAKAWRNFRIIFAIVYDGPTIDLAKERARISAIVAESDAKVDVRCYRLDELAKKFGIDA